jgi:hypothetical protein
MSCQTSSNLRLFPPQICRNLRRSRVRPPVAHGSVIATLLAVPLPSMPATEPLRREHFSQCSRVLVKVGTSIVTNDSGYLALGRMGHLVEQVSGILPVPVPLPSLLLLCELIAHFILVSDCLCSCRYTSFVAQGKR